MKIFLETLIFLFNTYIDYNNVSFIFLTLKNPKLKKKQIQKNKIPVRRTQSLYNSNTNYSSNYNMSKQQYKTPSFVGGLNRYSTMPSYNTTPYNSKYIYNNYYNPGKQHTTATATSKRQQQHVATICNICS